MRNIDKVTDRGGRLDDLRVGERSGIMSGEYSEAFGPPGRASSLQVDQADVSH